MRGENLKLWREKRRATKRAFQAQFHRLRATGTETGVKRLDEKERERRNSVAPAMGSPYVYLGLVGRGGEGIWEK